MAKKDAKEIKLRVFLLKYSGEHAAAECGVTRQAIHKAKEADRAIILLADGPKVWDAYEYIDKVHVFGFKG